MAKEPLIFNPLEGDTPEVRMLVGFAQDYMDWVECGAGPHPVFSRRYGMCRTVRKYVEEHAPRTSIETLDVLRHLMKYTWYDPCGGSGFPFGGCYQYDKVHDLMHLNYARLAWARWMVDGMPKGPVKGPTLKKRITEWWTNRKAKKEENGYRF